MSGVCLGLDKQMPVDQMPDARCRLQVMSFGFPVEGEFRLVPPWVVHGDMRGRATYTAS
jgi:hypothetical protein